MTRREARLRVRKNCNVPDTVGVTIKNIKVSIEPFLSQMRKNLWDLW